MTFKIIPAIDIIDGKLVRLYQGDYNQKTVYIKTPLEMAKHYEALGFKYIHVVDLNGAVDGNLTNLDTITQIIRNTKLEVQVGGGVRSLSHVKSLIEEGVSAVIIGSLFVQNFDQVVKIIHAYPNQIIAGLDIHDFKIASHGWTKTSAISLNTMLDQLSDLPLHSVLTTDIAKDGTFAGPNLDLYKKMALLTNHFIVASGGVAGIDDLKALKGLSLTNLTGCVVGKAIIEGRLSSSDIVSFL